MDYHCSDTAETPRTERQKETERWHKLNINIINTLADTINTMKSNGYGGRTIQRIEYLRIVTSFLCREIGLQECVNIMK